MGKLITNIKSIKDFSYIQGNFKDIPQFVNKELKFYFLRLDKAVHLKDIFEYLEKKYHKLNFDYQILEETKSEVLFYVKITKEIGQKQISLDTNIYLDKDKMNITLMSDDEKEKLFLLDNFIYKMFPFAIHKFIKSQEMVEIINDFLEEGYFISSSMVASKRWWEKVQRTGVDYPIDVPITEVLDELKKKKAFINSIVLNFYDKEKTNRVLKVYISRRGFIKFFDGYYDLFEEKILKKILKDNFSEQEMLKDRTRKDHEIKPLKLTFEKLTEFSPIEITKQFARSIAEARDFSLSIYHNGNPYFHASATNLSDGSVFTILFHNTDLGSELIITPQYSASSNSISKFLSTVYTNFGEGVIGEYVLRD